VVEDDPIVRGLIGEVLGELGYRSLEAVDGPSALRMLDSASRVDLLVTDIGLPGSTAARSPTQRASGGRISKFCS